MILKNLMHRRGLALDGDQGSLNAWKSGETPSIGNDGILMAEEVGGLKLIGTWLVTLSASETGEEKPDLEKGLWDCAAVSPRREHRTYS